MLELTPQQRRALRARAHHLHPVVSVGQHGMTAHVMHEVDRALAAHELVKVRIHNDDRDARERLLVQICDALNCAPVQHLGKLLILWRPAETKADESERDTKPRTKKKVARKPARVPGKGSGQTRPPLASPRRRRAVVDTETSDERAPRRAQARRSPKAPAERSDETRRTPVGSPRRRTADANAPQPRPPRRSGTAFAPRGPGQREGRSPSGIAPAPDFSRRRRRGRG